MNLLRLLQRLIHLLGHGANPDDIRIIVVTPELKAFGEQLAGPSDQQAEVDSMTAEAGALNEAMAAAIAAVKPERKEP